MECIAKKKEAVGRETKKEILGKEAGNKVLHACM